MPTNTTVLFSDDARKAMKRGVDTLANAVKATLGPAGRNVIIRNEQSGQPRITKDGVTVARTIHLEDKYEDMGAQLVKQAATKTVQMAGDGTTTSTLLAQEMISRGMEALGKEANAVEIKKGIDLAVKEVVAHLKENAIQPNPENMEWVATISANNNPTIGKLVYNAIQQVGPDGSITLSNSKTAECYLEKVDGLQLDRGYIHPIMINDIQKGVANFQDALIMLCERKLSSHLDLHAAWNIASANKRPLLIIAEDVDGDALGTIMASRATKGFPIAAIKLPGFGNMQYQMLEDIACITGGKVISEMKGDIPSQIDPSYLGSAKQVTISATHTTLIGGGGTKKAIADRIEEVKALIANHPDVFEQDKMKKQRLAKLVNGVGILYVGATTELERDELRDRIDDALCATRAAIEEGVVPGGGIAYLRAASAISYKCDNHHQGIGWEIVKNSLLAPVSTIIANAGKECSPLLKVLKDMKEYDGGYNAKTDKYEDFFATGIIDAAKVARVALENAASIAGMFLTTECAIADTSDK